jgi:hypothetical protein
MTSTEFYERQMFWRSGLKWSDVITERAWRERKRREAAKPKIGPPIKRKDPAVATNNDGTRKVDLVGAEIDRVITRKRERAQDARGWSSNSHFERSSIGNPFGWRDRGRE